VNVVSFVHEGLGNSSYLVGLGEGSAALVDPDRSVQRYLEAAAARGWRITHVFETHLHADFVSGSLETRRATGAELFVPEGANARFPHRPVRAGDTVQLPGGEAASIASPGHTPEHTSYVLTASGSAPALFSGGSLLVAGAARTDLISPELTDSLTRAQFRTITTAFSALPDEALLLPTHGGGSFCSAGAGGERTSTLGHARRTNPLLVETSEDAFAASFPATFPAAPRYFFRLRRINQAGPRLRETIPKPALLSAADFDRAGAGALVIDVRPQADFMAGHIPGAISNTFRDSFATWLGWLVPEEANLLFVLGDEQLEDAIDQALLVGYERFSGVLAGGMEAWSAAGLPVNRAELADVERAWSAIAHGAVALDVRETGEFAEGHLPGALHIPLGDLERRAVELPAGRPIVTYCGHGERSATGLSLLERQGLGPLINLDGGIEAWQAAGHSLATTMEGARNEGG
jgi:rhodanese-related sulfurtransferase/glyoxylase-like metal-dependent hydrolase (beta-lactamase superfamily II)